MSTLSSLEGKALWVRWSLLGQHPPQGQNLHYLNLKFLNKRDLQEVSQIGIHKAFRLCTDFSMKDHYH